MFFFAPGDAFMTSCRNGFRLIKEAGPLREVMSLRSGDCPPTLKKKLSVTKLINQLMSVDSTFANDVSEDHTYC